MQCLRGKRVRRMGLSSFEVYMLPVDSAVDAAMMMMTILLRGVREADMMKRV